MAENRVLPRRTVLREVLLALTVVVAGFAALFALHAGLAPFGASWQDDAHACTETVEAPGQVLPVNPHSAQRTWLPLGIICSVDIAQNGHPVNVAFQSWPATVVTPVAAIVALLALARLVAGRRTIDGEAAPI
jgi:hypothetical protein